MENIMGYNGSPYRKRYDGKKGWLGTESAISTAISVDNTEVFMRMVSPATGDEAIVRLATRLASDYGVASICRRRNGAHVNYIHVDVVAFINGDYELPEEGE